MAKEAVLYFAGQPLDAFLKNIKEKEYELSQEN
jgi:hypothetical protein